MAKPKKQFTSRHLGMLLEGVGKEVRIIAEQYGDIKSTLHDHTEMIGKLTVDVTIIKEDVEFIKHGLKRKVDVEEFAALERRVALLEKKR